MGDVGDELRLGPVQRLQTLHGLLLEQPHLLVLLGELVQRDRDAAYLSRARHRRPGAGIAAAQPVDHLLHPDQRPADLVRQVATDHECGGRAEQGHQHDQHQGQCERVVRLRASLGDPVVEPVGEGCVGGAQPVERLLAAGVHRGPEAALARRQLQPRSRVLGQPGPHGGALLLGRLREAGLTGDERADRRLVVRQPAHRRTVRRQIGIVPGEDPAAQSGLGVGEVLEHGAVGVRRGTDRLGQVAHRAVGAQRPDGAGSADRQDGHDHPRHQTAQLHIDSRRPVAHDLPNPCRCMSPHSGRARRTASQTPPRRHHAVSWR